jgi:hypothetical protein
MAPVDYQEERPHRSPTNRSLSSHRSRASRGSRARLGNEARLSRTKYCPDTPTTEADAANLTMGAAPLFGVRSDHSHVRRIHRGHARMRSVATTPGCTQLAATLVPSSRRASSIVNSMFASLVSQYARKPDDARAVPMVRGSTRPKPAKRDVTVTIRASLAARSCGSN